jgi:hypothetical protein
MIYLGAARVILLPSGFRRCSAGKAGQRNEHGGEGQTIAG